MASKPFVVGVVSAFFLVLAAGCAKKNRSEGGDPEATDEPFSPDNYVPPETFKVDSFDVPATAFDVGSPLSDQADAISGGLELTPSFGANLHDLSPFGVPAADAAAGLYLAEGKEPVFYAGFPISFKFSMRMNGGTGRMLMDFGLIEKAADGAGFERRDEFKACNLGTVEAAFERNQSGDGEQDLATFSATFVIPLSCLKDGQATRMMPYLAANTDGAVETKSGNAPAFIVFDDKLIAEQNLCLKLDKKATTCQNSFVVDKAPGLNVRLVDFVAQSSVGVLPAVDPAVTVSAGGQMPRPMLNTTGSFAIEGLAPDDPEKAAYTVEMRYELCAGLGGSGSGNTCDPNVEWLTLQTVDDESFTRDPRNAGIKQVFKNLEPGKPQTVSAPLHALGAVYNALKREKNGVWGFIQDFRVRACVTLLKNGVAVEQSNLDTQASNGDPSRDDCRLFPILLAEERADAATQCGAVKDDPASDEPVEAAEGSYELAGEPDHCKTAQVGGASGGQEEGEPDGPLENAPTGSTGVVTPSAVYAATWSTGWGSVDFQRLEIAVGPSLTLTPLAIDHSVTAKADLYGTIDANVATASFGGRFDLSGGDVHYVEPAISVLGLKIFGYRQVLPASEISYVVPIKEISGSNSKKKKKVKKGKKKKVKKGATKKKKPEVEDDAEPDPTALYVKEKCKEKTKPVSFVTIKVSVCGDIGLYLSVGALAEIRKPEDDEQDEFPEGIRLANAAFFFTPSIAANATAEASVGLVVARVGIGGEVKIIEVGVPAILSVRFGNYAKELNDGSGTTFTALGMKIIAQFTIDTEIEWLDGRLYAFAALDGPKFCLKWKVIPYPCGWGEIKRAEVDIMSFTGGSQKFSILKQDIASRAWEPTVATVANASPNGFNYTSSLTGGRFFKYNNAMKSANGKFYFEATGSALRLKDNLLKEYWKQTFTIPAGANANNIRIGVDLTGNFVVTLNGAVLWESKTSGNAGATLVLEDNGNLALKSSAGATLWQSNTVQSTVCRTSFPPNTKWKVGEKLCSKGGKATMQHVIDDGTPYNLTCSLTTGGIRKTVVASQPKDPIVQFESNRLVAYTTTLLNTAGVLRGQLYWAYVGKNTTSSDLVRWELGENCNLLGYKVSDNSLVFDAATDKMSLQRTYGTVPVLQ